MCNVRPEERTSAEELYRLKLKSMRERLQDRRLQWFGHLEKWKRMFDLVNLGPSRLAVVSQRTTKENME